MLLRENISFQIGQQDHFYYLPFLLFMILTFAHGPHYLVCIDVARGLLPNPSEYASNEDLKLIHLMVFYTEIIDTKILIYFLDILQTVTRMLEETG